MTIQELYALQLRTYDDVKTLAIQSKERIVEIYEQIIGEVLADTTLSDLNSTSRTAKWRLWAFIAAINIWLHEFQWIRYKAFLEEAARYAQSHTAAWYQQKAFEYQHGDAVTVVNGAVTYDPIVPDNRIVAACSVKSDSTGRVTVKVAKLDSGDLVALDSSEKTGFEGYLDRYKDAGVITSVVSLNADALRIYADVYYDPSQAPLDVFQPAFESAVVAYLQNLPFDGTVRVIRLIDAAQQVTGFSDINIGLIEASVAYVGSPTYVAFTLSYETVAGYINIDENFLLADTINYIANV